MGEEADDLEAVRALVQQLDPFEPKDQERIIRWAREKLGLKPVPAAPSGGAATHSPTPPTPEQPPGTTPATDIKSFIEAKKPASNNHFAAVVAYYYKFQAPQDQRKDSVNAEDLQEACRLANLTRLSKPGQTLVHAHHVGLLDQVERGQYAINTVGENLVAMTLPAEAGGQPAKPPRRKTKK